MYLNQFLLLAAILFCLGVYGVLARKNAVLVLMSIELMLNAVNLSIVAFAAFGAFGTTQDGVSVGSVIALMVMAVAAAEATVGLAIVIAIYRNKRTPLVDEYDAMKA
jgi:NADH:ubiquinone oxidoreductase subunit K